MSAAVGLVEDDRISMVQGMARMEAISIAFAWPEKRPTNMRDGIILGTGLGNSDWNNSAPHGAGRIYKRSEVAEHRTVSDFKKAMDGIYSICINKDTLDESPFAYRGVDEIASVIKETVKIEKIIKPVYNYKAGGQNQ